MGEPPSIDFLAAFRQGATLTADNKPVRLHVRLAGAVRVDSGRLLGTDPLDPTELVPYVRHVPPGHYPILLSNMEYLHSRRESGLGDSEYPALVMVRFRNLRPVSWELATREGQDARLLRPARATGYPTSSGFGAFLDARGLPGLKAVSGALETALKKVQGRNGFGAERSLGGSGLNVVAFSIGRGASASWWGLDAAGAPVCLLIDLDRLDGMRPPLGGDVQARRERIRGLTANVRTGEETARLEILEELAGYGGEAAEAVGPLLAIAAEDGGSEPWNSPLALHAASALARICKDAPEQVARVAQALLGARSEDQAFGLMQVASRIRGPHARPLIPVLCEYLRQLDHTDYVYAEALEALRGNMKLATAALPLVLEAGRRLQGLARYMAIYAVADFIDAGARPAVRQALAVLDPIRTDVEDTWSIQEAQLDLLDVLPPTPEVTARLVTLLDSMEVNVPFWAAEQLLQKGAHLATAEAALRKLEESEPRRVRDWMRKRLKQLPH